MLQTRNTLDKASHCIYKVAVKALADSYEHSLSNDLCNIRASIVITRDDSVMHEDPLLC